MQDYVDWVRKIMDVFSREWRSADANTKLVGIDIRQIILAINKEIDSMPNEVDQGKVEEGVRDALRDLANMGLLEEDSLYYKLTHEGSKYPKADLSTAWEQITNVYLEDEQMVFLKKVAEIGQEITDKYTRLTDLSVQQVFEAIGWPWDEEGSAKGYFLSKTLVGLGMIQREAYLGGQIDIAATYAGIVRVTREIESQWNKLVNQLVEEWETTNVDFKRELHITRDKEKAEFIRDVLGIATTRSSGRRFLIIGFDNKTRTFIKSVDPGINQERLEQILQAYCEPVPTIRYQVVPSKGGNIGIIEIFRNSRDIPYRVKKNLAGEGGIKAGEIYVRHGSHTEGPTPRELEDLLNEKLT